MERDVCVLLWNWEHVLGDHIFLMERGIGNQRPGCQDATPPVRDLRRSKVPGGRVALADPPVPLWKLVHPLGLA